MGIVKRLRVAGEWALPYIWHGPTLHAFAKALVIGSARIVGRTWRWCRDPKGDRDARGLAVAAPLLLAGWAVYRQPTFAPTTLAIGWIIAAVRTAPRDLWNNLAAQDAATPAAIAEERPEPEVIPAAEWVRLVIGNANGIHLTDLLDLAQSNGQHLGLDYAAFRTALEARGIPVRKNLKVAGRNRPGIARADLPPTPEPAPSPCEPQEAADSHLPAR